jgi:hypothetical protein
LSRALALVEYYLVPTWRRVLAAFGKTQTESAAMRIARVIIAERMNGVRISDIIKRDWHGLKDRATAEAALDDLVARDWLAAPERTTGPRGGRPSETYRVNPRVFQMETGNHEYMARSCSDGSCRGWGVSGGFQNNNLGKPPR